MPNVRWSSLGPGPSTAQRSPTMPSGSILWWQTTVSFFDFILAQPLVQEGPLDRLGFAFAVVAVTSISLSPRRASSALGRWQPDDRYDGERAAVREVTPPAMEALGAFGFSGSSERSVTTCTLTPGRSGSWSWR